jgi:ATP-dependent RNA helicase DDX5/DBP2
MDKQRRLQQIFRAEERGSKIIIFCSTEKICNQPSCGIVVVLVPQAFMVINHRYHILNQFWTAHVPVLAATDVAAG